MLASEELTPTVHHFELLERKLQRYDGVVEQLMTFEFLTIHFVVIALLRNHFVRYKWAILKEREKCGEVLILFDNESGW